MVLKIIREIMHFQYKNFIITVLMFCLGTGKCIFTLFIANHFCIVDLNPVDLFYLS